MKIRLIDVDSHHYPNLALMKISAYHKAQGDIVEWYWGFSQYDRLYMSKVFDDTYTPDIDEPLNAKEIIKGGTGYGLDNRLPEEIVKIGWIRHDGVWKTGINHNDSMVKSINVKLNKNFFEI